MDTWVCAACHCRYKAGAPRCPECPETKHTVEESVPKITVAGGPSYEGDAPAQPAAPELEAASVAAPEPEPVPAAEPVPAPEPAPVHPPKPKGK